MLPYYILVFIPFIVYVLGLIKHKKNDKLCISLFFMILLLLLFLRSWKTGIDLVNYKYFFNSISKLSFNGVVNYSEKGEVLFYILNKIIYIIFGNHFQIFLIILAMLAIIPIFKLYYTKSDNALLTIVLFITVAPFSMFFSGIRQCVAMGIIIFAFKYVENKKIIKYLLCVALAYFFHRSAIFCLFLYPLYHAKITKKWLYVIIPIMLVIFVFNKQIFTTILNFTSLYDGNIESTGAYSILILLILFAVYCFIFPSDNKITKEFIGLRNILLLTIMIQMFAPIHATVMRINYYYLLFIPILIPKVIKVSEDENMRLLDSSVIIMTLFFIVYFFYKAYTGSDILQIFPYIPFWEV